jgi:serine/threonine protein kinase
MVQRDTRPPVLRGFTFSKVLGAGGFSDVFLYDQELPKRKVAVKVLLAEGLTPENRNAFVAEANLMAMLSAHPYIVTIFHADVADDGRPYFIMEYCSGPNLADRYKQSPLTVPEAIRTGVRVAGAVATAHQAGVLHRDIKPANILTNDFGWPALTDFGISSTVVDEGMAQTTTRAAIASGDTGGTGSTGSRSVGLSVPWSPPEMFEDAPAPDVRSDVYSLAATIYTLLAGYSPFEVPGGRNQSLDLMGRIERGAITPLTRTDVPASLLTILKKGMAVKASARYDSAVDFARALQRVELELNYQPTPIDVPNLVVPAPDAPAGPAEDETRARGVTTVAAQQRTVPAASPDAAPLNDATMIRSAAGTHPATRSPSPDADGARGPRKRRSKVGLVVGGVSAVIVLAVAGALAATSGDPKDPGIPSPSSTPHNDTILGDVVPAPALESAAPSADGTSVTFKWSNPAPVEGDIYIWQRTDGAAAQDRFPVEAPEVTIDEVTPGTTVCISVWIRRDQGGKLSAEPMEECYP